MNKMKKAVFTSILPNYLPKALILGDSICRNGGEDIDFYIAISEKKKNRTSLKGWKVLYLDDFIDEEHSAWAMMHDVVELCTAIKPFVMSKLLKSYDSVLYIDPDIKVYNSLDNIYNNLDKYDCILAPHLNTLDNTKNNIVDHELSILKHGIYNLGFLGLSNSANGIEINEFWRSRCYYFCERNSDRGVFTDQKFFDLVPFYFNNVYIDKSSGIDVASWNLFERKISISSNGTLLANDVPLIFYHFSSFDNGDGLMMTTIHGRESPILFELWANYILEHSRVTKFIPESERLNEFNVTYKGIELKNTHRKLLREILITNGVIKFTDFDSIVRE